MSLRTSKEVVPPVLNALTMNSLSLLLEGSGGTGDTGEGDGRDDDDGELTGIAGPSLRIKESSVNFWVTWLVQTLGDAWAFLRLLIGSAAFFSCGTSSIR